MHPLAIDRRLGELERRVRRIEQHVRLPAEPAEELSTKSLLDPQLPQMQPARQHEFHPARVAAQPPAVAAPGEAPADAIILPYPPIPKPKPVLQNPLEQTIGIKWAGWVGAIVLVIGAALGIKYAYDNHLLPTVPPIMRLVMMSLGGFGLIAAGEWVYRKIGRLSASGFFGAGVATLFVISYAGYGAYSLYTRETALVMMALCTLIGSAVAMRAQLVSVAVLALLGGNIAPLVLHEPITNPVPFLLYLLMLEAVALIVAHWGAGEKWWALRGLPLVTTSLWMASLLARPHIDFAWAPEMWFALLYAILFHAELLLSELRKAKRPVDESAGAVFSLLVTALVSAAILRIFWVHEAWIRGMWIILRGSGAFRSSSCPRFWSLVTTSRPSSALHQILPDESLKNGCSGCL